MDLKLKDKYDSYPPHIKTELLNLRKVILGIAIDDADIDFIGEDLKWGEPSFLTKSSGSTFRIDWKKRAPNSISLFFNCNSKLIRIFKSLYPNDFEYIGNREIRLALSKKYSKAKLKKCIELALKYNLIKNRFD